MDLRTLDALRRILAPLDLRPLLWVVDGDHLRGFDGPGSPVTVHGIHREALGAALGEGRRLFALTVDLLDEGLTVRVRSEDRDRTARRLLAGDGRVLETLHSPFVLAGDDEAAAIRGVARGFVTRKYPTFCLREADRAARALSGESPRGLRALPRLFRALLAGLHVLGTGGVEPDLRRLARWNGAAWLTRLAATPFRSSAASDPAFLEFLLGEAAALRDALVSALPASRLPDAPGPEAVAALDRWRG
ncbi:MAG: nucleotidyltransferase domain-containing protein [Planctomycetes bacterium]|jgi:hypothetical protein|nr:nucleotidyltransferase domain-containing protein [Planctomycetota bacterium]